MHCKFNVILFLQICCTSRPSFTGDASRCCRKARIDPDLEVEIGDILDNSAAKHKLSIRPRRNHADPRARSSPSIDSDLSLER
jgi:hypothetical protein